MLIYELFHYSLFPSLFVAFTYNKNQPLAFCATPEFLCILLSFLGLSFRHIPNNLSNYNVLTANAPIFYQISGTWSNHEGSILLWCRILSFYGFLLCYRGRPQSSNNVSKRGGHREKKFIPFSRTSLRTPFYLALVTYKKVDINTSCTLPSFVEPLLILYFVREGTGLLTSQPLFLRHFTLKEKFTLLL